VVWARHFGASQVLVSDRVPERREMAERLGATGTAAPGPELDDLLATRIPEGADVVIEAVGAPGLIQQALAAVRFRGRVVVAGVCMGPDTIQPFPAITKEASVHFVLAYEKDDFQYTIDMLEAGRISPQPMVTSQVALEDVPGAFETLATPCEQCKVLFVADDVT
jgi:(R,R)-butanediol dehydrogenase/meso-butanediol dehydrogenase/diacetyl reductase